MDSVPSGCWMHSTCHMDARMSQATTTVLVRVTFSPSVWGAYWSIGADIGWPNGNTISHPVRLMLTSALGGEIDIFEGVNMQNSNQMTMHTGPGCSMPHGLSQTGTQLGTDCGPSSNNAGCAVLEANTKSYGKP